MWDSNPVKLDHKANAQPLRCNQCLWTSFVIKLSLRVCRITSSRRIFATFCFYFESGGLSDSSGCQPVRKCSRDWFGLSASETGLAAWSWRGHDKPVNPLLLSSLTWNAGSITVDHSKVVQSGTTADLVKSQVVKKGKTGWYISARADQLSFNVTSPTVNTASCPWAFACCCSAEPCDSALEGVSRKDLGCFGNLKIVFKMETFCAWMWSFLDFFVHKPLLNYSIIVQRWHGNKYHFSLFILNGKARDCFSSSNF